MPEYMAKCKRILKWTGLGLLALVIGFLVYFFSVAVDHPPHVEDLSALQIQREKTGENTYFFGNNWLRKSESGLWEMYIEGDAFERGVAFGKLTRELLYYQETAFIEQIQELVPSRNYLKFLKYFIAWFNRNLDKNITDEYKTEIYGTSLSCSARYNFIGSAYQRQLNYHAAHDIGHALQGLNMVGCTSFSCWKEKSADSTLIVGRNFDFYVGKKFAENKIICFCNPNKGYKFMMITWADMVGVVSGMNEKGLTVTINASKSAIPGQAATPVTLLAREILQYAGTLDEACAISVKRKLFVSESILVGSAKDGESLIIEKSPRKYDIFRSQTHQIICANHFQGETFRYDKSNIENIRGSDSKYRFDRIHELLKADSAVDVADAVSILRNRQGLGNAELGMGNPLAINQLIAHHSVVFKPALGLVWVSTTPYQLGKYVCYDINKIFSLQKEEIKENHEIYTSQLTIQSDTFLFSPAYKDFTAYLKMSGELKHFQHNEMMLPENFVNRYVQTNPQFFLTYSRLADYYFDIKDYTSACNFYQKALSKKVAGLNLQFKLQKQYQKSFKKLQHAHTRN
jgi:isopenicillin-N N-acyltransferase like protein